MKLTFFFEDEEYHSFELEGPITLEVVKDEILMNIYECLSWIYGDLNDKNEWVDSVVGHHHHDRLTRDKIYLLPTITWEKLLHFKVRWNDDFGDEQKWDWKLEY